MTSFGHRGRRVTFGAVLAAAALVGAAGPAFADPPSGQHFTRVEGFTAGAGVSVSFSGDGRFAVLGSARDEALHLYQDRGGNWRDTGELWAPFDAGLSGDASALISGNAATIAGYFHNSTGVPVLAVWHRAPTGGYALVMGASPASGMPVSVSADGTRVLTTSSSTPYELHLLTVSSSGVGITRIHQALPVGAQGLWQPSTAQLTSDGSSFAIGYPGGVEILKAAELFVVPHLVVGHPVTGFSYSHDGSTLATVDAATMTVEVARLSGYSGWIRTGTFTAPSTAGAGLSATSAALSSGGYTLAVGWHANAGLYRYSWDGKAWHFGGTLNNTPAERTAGANGLRTPVVSADGKRLIGLAPHPGGSQDAVVFDAATSS